ncbi:MAG: nicotinamide mononucleotide transporter [Clostridiales bacterium]|nr:nicotinamide mononucleotide transporter [Clostridiales bacterium]
MRNPFKSFTKFEWALWIFSLVAITVSHFVSGSKDHLTYATSLVGVTSLIFTARGDVLAPFLLIAFAVCYGLVSFFFGYYGETMIYAFMQMPICIVSIVTWLKNVSGKQSKIVKVGTLDRKKIIIMAVLAAVVTCAFHFILRYFGTKNLIPSTISVFMSFIALYLMALRIPQYALAFVLNDMVLIVLWSLACTESITYISLVVCFSIFMINDLYSFYSWRKRKKESQETDNIETDNIETDKNV